MGRRQFGSVRRLPSGRWQVRYHNGLGKRVVAPDTFATKADAQRWLAVAQADILRGTFIDPSAGRTSFAEWAEDWLASKMDDDRSRAAGSSGRTTGSWSTEWDRLASAR
jgi:hypothetical protein